MRSKQTEAWLRALCWPGVKEGGTYGDQTSDPVGRERAPDSGLVGAARVGFAAKGPDLSLRVQGGKRWLGRCREMAQGGERSGSAAGLEVSFSLWVVTVTGPVDTMAPPVGRGQGQRRVLPAPHCQSLKRSRYRKEQL